MIVILNEHVHVILPTHTLGLHKSFLRFRRSFVDDVPSFMVFSSLILQIFCLVAIIATKLKHFIEERSHRMNNQVQPLNSKEQKQPISLIAIDVIQRKNRSRDHFNSKNNSKDEDISARSKPTNTTIYNKNLIEVCHISYICVVIVLSLAKLDMIDHLKSKGDIVKYCRPLIILLDVAPATMVSVLLPLIIVLRHHEMQNWIKGFFRKPQNSN